jgi:hypothetical protein
MLGLQFDEVTQCRNCATGIRASLLAELELLTTAKTKVRFTLFVADLDVLEMFS